MIAITYDPAHRHSAERLVGFGKAGSYYGTMFQLYLLDSHLDVHMQVTYQYHRIQSTTGGRSRNPHLQIALTAVVGLLPRGSWLSDEMMATEWSACRVMGHLFEFPVRVPVHAHPSQLSTISRIPESSGNTA